MSNKNKKNKKLPAWLAKAMLIVASLLAINMIFSPFCAIFFGEEALPYCKASIIAFIGGGFGIFALLFLLDKLIGFQEKKATPLSIPCQQESAGILQELTTDLLQMDYQLVCMEQGEEVYQAELFLKPNRSFDYVVSFFVPKSIGEEVGESFLNEADALLRKMVDILYDQTRGIRRPIGMIILVVANTMSVDLKLALQERTAQDLQKSSVLAVIVLNEDKAYISNLKDVFAIKRYHRIQKEAIKVLQSLNKRHT